MKCQAKANFLLEDQNYVLFLVFDVLFQILALKQEELVLM